MLFGSALNYPAKFWSSSQAVSTISAAQSDTFRMGHGLYEMQKRPRKSNAFSGNYLHHSSLSSCISILGWIVLL